MDKVFLPKNYDYIELNNGIEALLKKYTFIKKKSIGKSCLGKEITALVVGNGENFSLIAAGFHGSEHITTNVLMMWFEDICEAIYNNTYLNGINIKKALYGRGIVIVPRVNLDGCDISIKGEKACGEKAEEIRNMVKGDFVHYNANYRGVDINHNFNANWAMVRANEKKLGILGPAPTRFGGYSPESEPETKALCDLCRHNNIRHVIALHSQGRVIYWTYGEQRPYNSRRMAEILSTASGYALDYAVGIADGGGFKDWFIKEFDRPGFTIEIGKGKNPLHIESAKDLYYEVKECLTLSIIL